MRERQPHTPASVKQSDDGEKGGLSKIQDHYSVFPCPLVLGTISLHSEVSMLSLDIYKGGREKKGVADFAKGGNKQVFQ